MAPIPYLWEIKLNDNLVTDISPLAAFSDTLTQLGFSRNPLQSIQVLEQFDGLRMLNLDDTGLTTSDLYAIGDQPSLWYLDLSDNQITGLDPITGLPWLQTLLVGGNPMITLPAFDSGYLTFINASDCMISNLTQFQYNTEIDIANLSGNRIQNIQPLANMPKLDKLDLSDNRIRSIAAYLDHPGFSRFSHFWIGGNCINLALSSNSDVIDYMNSEGVDVISLPQGGTNCFNPLPGRIKPPTPM